MPALFYLNPSQMLNHLILRTTLWDRYYGYLHLKEDKIEIQRG